MHGIFYSRKNSFEIVRSVVYIFWRLMEEKECSAEADKEYGNISEKVEIIIAIKYCSCEEMVSLTGMAPREDSSGVNSSVSRKYKIFKLKVNKFRIHGKVTLSVMAPVKFNSEQAFVVSSVTFQVYPT
jgi:hypothetical protein